MAKLPPPPLRFLVAHPAHFIACGCGSGLSPFAPGTAGTAFAWVTYGLLRQAFPADGLFLLVLGGAFLIGVLACHLTGRHLGVVDHGAIVWDEVIGFGVTMIAAPAGWEWVLAGFVLFRLFDVLKPWPISWFDRRIHGGLGIMLDDLIAGLFALLCMQLLARW